jgi:hypothetical protein
MRVTREPYDSLAVGNMGDLCRILWQTLLEAHAEAATAIPWAGNPDAKSCPVARSNATHLEPISRSDVTVDPPTRGSCPAPIQCQGAGVLKR